VKTQAEEHPVGSRTSDYPLGIVTPYVKGAGAEVRIYHAPGEFIYGDPVILMDFDSFDDALRFCRENTARMLGRFT